MEPTTKKTEQNILVLIVVVVLVGLFLTVANNGDNDENAKASGDVVDSKTAMTVNWKEGEVLFSGNGEIWEFADSGTLLGTGFSIRTNGGAKAILETPEGSLVRLNENTELKVSQLSKKQVLLSLNSGKVYSRVNKGEDDYQLNALGYTIRANGTAFDIATNPTAKRINVKVLDDSVNLKVNGEDLVVEAGKEITVDPEAENGYSRADISKAYIESDWFQWNKSEDEKAGFELAIADEIMKKEVTASAAPTTVKSTTTKSTSTTTTTTKSTSTYSAGTCTPSLSAKKAYSFGGILLNWTKCNNESFQFYKVLRSSTNSYPSYPAGPVVLSTSNRSNTSYLDKNVVKYRPYYYRACALERLGKVSCGNVVSITY